MTDALLIENCDILTAEGKSKARSIFIRRGRIERLSEDATQGVPADTVRVDGTGATVVPGLIDTHCHLTKLGEGYRLLDLRGVTSATSLRFRLATRVAALGKGEWVIGTGWDQERFPGGRFPERRDIDDVTGQNPAILYRVCGHVALLNSRAMELLCLDETAEAGSAGRGKETAASPYSPEAFETDEAGRRTGIVREAALGIVEESIPKAPRATIEMDILSAELEAAKNGLTTVHCILSSRYPDEIEAFASLPREREPPPSVPAVHAGRGPRLSGEARRARPPGGRILRMVGVKIYADGTLGARTAALRRAYDDDGDVDGAGAGNLGMLRYADEEMAALILRADALGYQVMIHAIGDRAIAQAVHALSRLPRARRTAGRHRIEHASLCPPDLVEAIREVGARVSVQPHFAISDTWAEERLGPVRILDLYPFRSFIESGIVVSAGSDAPVEPISPILGLWAAMSRVRRRREAGRDGKRGRGRRASFPPRGVAALHPSAAENSFDETEIGDIREGLAADLTVIDSQISRRAPRDGQARAGSPRRSSAARWSSRPKATSQRTKLDGVRRRRWPTTRRVGPGDRTESPRRELFAHDGVASHRYLLPLLRLELAVLVVCQQASVDRPVDQQGLHDGLVLSCRGAT